MIYSKIDGLNHQEILNGKESAERYSLELIYKIDTTLSDNYFNIFIERLNNGSKIWKPYYLNALSMYCNKIDDEQNLLLEAAIFNYLLYNPKEYLENIEKMSLEKSDCFLEKMASYVQEYLSQNEITIISMKNVAQKYCDDCKDHEIKLLYNYLDLANKYQTK
jgi:hypothetical protein|tara:strand:- start:978 stop:1466 length:489 start_codon:yes stop_codon:yes gene_type:complete